MEFEPLLWLQIKGVTFEEQVTWLSQSGHLGPPPATVIGSGTACDLSWPIRVSLITLCVCGGEPEIKVLPLSWRIGMRVPVAQRLLVALLGDAPGEGGVEG